MVQTSAVQMRSLFFTVNYLFNNSLKYFDAPLQIYNSLRLHRLQSIESSYRKMRVTKYNVYRILLYYVFYTFEIGAQYYDDLILFRHARYECVNIMISIQYFIPTQ